MPTSVHHDLTRLVAGGHYGGAGAASGDVRSRELTGAAGGDVRYQGAGCPRLFRADGAVYRSPAAVASAFRAAHPPRYNADDRRPGLGTRTYDGTAAGSTRGRRGG